MNANDKKVLPVLYSLPVTERLKLPARAEILPKIESGELEFLEFRAVVFNTSPNRNFYVFRPEDLAGFAASFEGQPYLRDHETCEIEARDGTILSSSVLNGEFVQDIRITTRRGMTDYIEGRMDRFSIGWNSDDVICTICNSSWMGTACSHWPGRKYQTVDGEKVCQLLFINPMGVETSAVNVPAVENTSIVTALEMKHDIMRGQLAALSAAPATGPETAQSNLEAGQAPAAGQEIREVVETQARSAARQRRLALNEAGYPSFGGNLMNVREILAQRGEKLQAARALASQADTELRDFSDEERGQFDSLMTEVETLTKQVETIGAERARLQAAEETPALASGQAEKPEAAQAAKIMKRAEFDQLAATERAGYVRSGGKIED